VKRLSPFVAWVALAVALSVPIGAQNGWFSQNGTNMARASSSTTAVSIRQDGTGAILDLFDGATRVFRVADGGGVSAAAGTGSGSVGLGGVLTVSTTSAQTTAVTTEETLWTYNLPANTLSSDNYGVRITVWGQTGATANTKNMRVYCGAQSRGLLTGASNNGHWVISAIVTRTGATTQKAVAWGQGGPGGLITTNTSSPTETLSGAVTIAMKGTNGTAAAGDIVFLGAIVEFLRAGA
jgi:hypothetical protein